jgi:hypothetical protein
MANLSNINNKFIVTDGNNGRVLIGATNDIGATLFANHPSTTAPSLTFNAPAGQVFENEDLQIAFGLNNASPYNGYMQTRFVSAPYYRNLAINPLGGNVGIGTNSPGYKLDVVGSIKASVQGRFASGSASTPAYSFDSDSDSGIYRATTNALGFATAGVERMRIDSSGNVLINDGSLEVQKVPAAAQNTVMLNVDCNPTGNTGSGIIEISAGSNNQAKTQIEQVTSGGSGQYGTYIDTNFINKGLSASAHGNINFVTGSSTSASSIVMTIGGGSQKGNVGIGDTSPSTKIDVYQSIVGIGAADFRHVNGNRILINPSYNYYDAYNHIFRGLSGTNTHMTIDLNGNVGIGVTGPLSPLTVQANSGGSALRFIGRSDGISGIDFFNSTQTVGNYFQSNGTWIRSRADGGFHFSKGSTPITTDVDGFTIEGMNVGIGTTSPGAELQVVGRIKTTRIVSSNIILGNIRSNVVGTAYLLLVDLNITAGFSLAGKVNAASYTTWNVSDIYVRKNYNATTGYATITGISKSGSTLSVVDISHSSGRFIALKLTGDPEVDVMWAGYRLDALFQGSGEVTTLTSGVTENSVYASY